MFPLLHHHKRHDIARTVTRTVWARSTDVPLKSPTPWSAPPKRARGHQTSAARSGGVQPPRLKLRP